MSDAEAFHRLADVSVRAISAWVRRKLGDPLIVHLFAKSTVAVGLKTAGALLSIVVALLVSRSLGAEQAGYYFLAVSVVVFLSAPGSVGLNNAVLKLVAATSGSRDRDSQNAAFGLAMLIAGLTSLVIGLMLWCSASTLSEVIFDKPAMQSVFHAAAVALPLFVLFVLTSHALQGRGDVTGSMALVGPVQYVVLAVLLVVLKPTQATGAAHLYAVSAAVTLGVALWLWFREEGAGFSTAMPMANLTVLGLPMLATQVVGQFNAQAGNLFLGFWSGPEDIAYFSVSLRLAMVISFVLLAVNRVAAPRFALLYGGGELHELARLVKWVTRLLMVSSLPILLVMMAMPGMILQIFGDEFRQATAVIRLLAVGQFINVITGPVGMLLQMTGHERVYRNCVLGGALAGVALAFVLVPTYGAVGAAWMTVITLGSANLLAWNQVRVRLDINTLRIW